MTLEIDIMPIRLGSRYMVRQVQYILSHIALHRIHSVPDLKPQPTNSTGKKRIEMILLSNRFSKPDVVADKRQDSDHILHPHMAMASQPLAKSDSEHR
jgi:hypothetical protein